MKKKYLYYLILAGSLLYIAFFIYLNLFYNPSDTNFLKQKTNVVHPVYLPVWLTVMHTHVLSASITMFSGILNFSTILRKRRTLHHMNGYIYMIGVFVICLTSGYMAPSSTGGRISSIAFDLINLLWPFITLMAFIKIKKGQVERHRRWMIRSYAFCFTNLFIHLLGFLFHSGLGMTFVASYIAAVYGAILLDLLTAELVIHKISMIKETDLSI